MLFFLVGLLSVAYPSCASTLNISHKERPAVEYIDPDTVDIIRGVAIWDYRWARQFHRRCNPDDPKASARTLPRSRTSKAWRLEWLPEDPGFPCSHGTAPGITCTVRKDDSLPGEEGFYWKLLKVELPNVGLHCEHEVMLADYKLDALIWIDLSGRNNRIDLDTLRYFILPSAPKLRHLDVAHALRPESRIPGATILRHLTSRRVSDKKEWSICDMTDLDYVDITNAGISGPLLDYDCLENLHYVTDLRLRGNNFTGCGNPLDHTTVLTKLSHLDLGSNLLSTSPTFKIRTIKTSNNGNVMSQENRTYTLDSCLGFQALTRLELDNNIEGFVGKLPSTLCKSGDTLESLDLSHNPGLTELPACFSDSLVRLTSLDLSQTSATQGVGDGWDSPFVEIPGGYPFIRGLFRLRYLDLSNMLSPMAHIWKPRFLPSGIGVTDPALSPQHETNYWPSLEFLNLSWPVHKWSTTLANGILLFKNATIITPNLRVLDVSGVGLGGDLAVVSRLNRLRELHAGENSFTGNFDFTNSMLGGGFGQKLPESLEILDLHSNSMQGHLEGNALFSLRSLRILRLSGNDLASEAVPFDYFFGLSQLEVLDLAHNELLQGYLPEQAPVSPVLSTLDLRGVVLGIDDSYLNSKESYIIMDRNSVGVISSHSEQDSSSSFSRMGCFELRVLQRMHHDRDSNNVKSLQTPDGHLNSRSASLIVKPDDTGYSHCICLSSSGLAPYCAPCPRNSRCSLFNGSLECYSGYWYDPDENQCKSCRKRITAENGITEIEVDGGMDCDRDGTIRSTILVRKGYWRVEGKPREEDTSYQPCTIPEACLGGNNSGNCSTGYAGNLCLFCDDGAPIYGENVMRPRFYLGADAKCHLCITEPAVIEDYYGLWAVLFSFTIFTGLCFGVYVLYADTYHYESLGTFRARQKFPNVFFGYFTNPTTLTFFGHMSMIASLATNYPHIQWTPQAQSILSVIGIIFDFNIISLETIACRFAGKNNIPVQPHIRVVMLAVVPIAIGFYLMAIYLACVVFLWRLWIIHQENYEENDKSCFNIREREFPENIVVLVRRRVVCFYAFLSMFLFPAFFSNAIRGSPVLPCTLLIGSQEAYNNRDPLIKYTAMNEYFKFYCTGKGQIVDAFYITLFMSLFILGLHCFIVPLSTMVWLFRNRRYIVNFCEETSIRDLGGKVDRGTFRQHKNHNNNPEAIRAIEAGTVLSLQFYFAHYRRGNLALRIFGNYLELLLRASAIFLSATYRNTFHGLLYAAMVFALHFFLVSAFRPYSERRWDVYVMTAACDASTVSVLLASMLYHQENLDPKWLDHIFLSTSVALPLLSLLLHILRECTVVRTGRHRAAEGVGGPKHRDTGSAWGRRYGLNENLSNSEEEEQVMKDEKEIQPVVTIVQPFPDSEDDQNYQSDDVPAGADDGTQGVLVDMGVYSANGTDKARRRSPPKSPFKFGRTKPGIKGTAAAKKLIQDRAEKDIRFKLKAWWYRFSYVQRWHDAFRKEHHKIPSRIDVGKDPDLVRNQSRLDLRTRELAELGIHDPAAAFRERNLKPKPDTRLVSVPKDTTSDGRESIVAERGFLEEVEPNRGLEWRADEHRLNSYDSVLQGSAPGSKRKHKNMKAARMAHKHGWVESNKNKNGAVGGSGKHRLHALPRRSMYTLFSPEQRADAPPPLEREPLPPDYLLRPS